MSAAQPTPAASDAADAPAVPTVEVVRGNVTPEEIAAVSVVLAAALTHSAAEARSRRTEGWSSRRRTLNTGVSVTGWGRP